MKSKIFFTTLTIILTLQVSCQSDTTKLKEESRLIVDLLYNIESNKFPVPPPPDGSPNKKKSNSKIYMNDKNIYKTKYLIAIRKNANIEYKEENDFPKDFRKILFEPSSIFLSKNFHTINFKDLKENLIPVISYGDNSKIQDITKNYQVLGVLFFLDIKFNKNLNKASLQFGAYTHEMSGYTSILCLEKKHGIWQVVYSKNQSES